MKILVHLLYSGLGGHGAVLFSLLESGFCKDWHHKVVFVGIEKPREEYMSRCESLNISWVYVGKQQGRSHAVFIWRLYKLLLELNANALFLHGLATVPSTVLLLLRTRGRPFVLLRETQAHSLKRKKDWLLLYLASVFFDKIVYLTNEAFEGARKYFGPLFTREKSIVIPNGVDTAFFFPRKIERVTNEILLGMQSRLQINKDHKTLIDALVLLHAKNPNLKIRLAIAGDGETLDSLTVYAKSLGISQCVTFLGMLDQMELRDFLSSLTIYVHATHGETMSTAILQALAMGLPIVASNVFGVSNMLQNDVGLLYNPGNAHDLAKKIDLLISNPLLAKDLSKMARIVAVSKYSSRDCVRSYNEIFTNDHFK